MAWVLHSYYCMDKALTVEAVRTKYHQLHPLMTERLRRQWAACEAESLGRGGPSIVAEATGLSRTTIWSGRANSSDGPTSPGMTWLPNEFGPRAADAISWSKRIRRSSPTCRFWSTHRRGGIRNHLCAGPPRVYGGLPRN